MSRTKVTRDEWLHLSAELRRAIHEDMKNHAVFAKMRMEWEIAEDENDPKKSALDVEAKKNYKENYGKNKTFITHLNDVDYRILVPDLREMICVELGDTS